MVPLTGLQPGYAGVARPSSKQRERGILGWRPSTVETHTPHVRAACLLHACLPTLLTRLAINVTHQRTLITPLLADGIRGVIVYCCLLAAVPGHREHGPGGGLDSNDTVIAEAYEVVMCPLQSLVQVYCGLCR